MPLQIFVDETAAESQGLVPLNTVRTTHSCGDNEEPQVIPEELFAQLAAKRPLDLPRAKGCVVDLRPGNCQYHGPADWVGPGEKFSWVYEAETTLYG